MVVVVLGALSRAAVAQPWADAYKAGDYAKAVHLLQPIVIGQQESLGAATDPAPSRLLAVLYAEGRGVARDEVIACSLAQLSAMARETTPAQPKTIDDYNAYKASLDESQQFVRGLCDPLTDRQRLAAAQGMGCFAFGLTEGTLTLGDRTVVVDRVGVRLAESDTEATASNLWCSQLVARLEARTVAPPADAAPGVRARYFVELLSWDVGKMPDSSQRYFLTWKMFELRGKTLEPVAMESFDSVDIWPVAPVPPDFESRFHLEMIRSGHIRWRLDGAPPKRGWIMLPEGEPR